MTQAQWDQHMEHFDEHITWPATKQEILEACAGTDVEPQVLSEIKSKLMDGDRRYTEAEFQNLLVNG
jgi:hypothetical protein